MSAHLPSHAGLQWLALTGAVLLHSGVAFWAMQPSPPVAIPQQVLQVAMVAPSSPEQQKAEAVAEQAPVVPPKPEGMRKIQPKAEKKIVKKEKREEAKKESVAMRTSGQQAPDATETHSAKTDPVFDAAYLRNPAPAYPDYARKRGIAGRVLLEVSVQADGQAREVVVARSSGSSALDDAARDAVSRWKFVPARRGSELVEASVIVPVEFKLN